MVFIHILYFTVFVGTCSDIGGVTFSGMNCAEVVAQSPSNCYSDLVKLYCCGSCAAVSTGTPGKLNNILDLRFLYTLVLFSSRNKGRISLHNMTYLSILFLENINLSFLLFVVNFVLIFT